MNYNEDFNQADINEYHDYQDNRGRALALLAKLKSRPVQTSKVIWKDGQPTVVETSRNAFKTPGLDLSDGLPATDTQDRVPSSWEAKLERKRRRQYTLAETPTLTYSSDGNMLPAHYYAPYMDENEMEAYINSLNKNDE